MDKLSLFIPLTKVDVEKRLVFGTIAEEVPDRANEIMDYASARPEFEKWSGDMEKASDGRSVGNLRAMHGNVAAGKLTAIDFDDAAKRIGCCGKVVDDAEWNKVLEGVYTGFSIGGKYLKRWKDADNPRLTRYTPQPAEVSLVDYPCIPTATFEVVKADGTVELRKFHVPTNIAPDVEQGWRAKDGSFHLTKAAAVRRNSESGTDMPAQTAASLSSSDATAGSRLTKTRSSERPYGDVAYADPGYQQDGKKRYPIDTKAHIRAAWNYINTANNQKPYSSEEVSTIRAKIVSAWKEKIDGDGPPEAADKSAMPESLAKSLHDVAEIAQSIETLNRIKGWLANEAAMERDHSPAAGELEKIVDELCTFLQTLCAEETSEVIAGEECEGDEDDSLERAVQLTYIGKLGKRVQDAAFAIDALKPQLDVLTKRLNSAEAEIERLNAQPARGGPVLAGTRMITKSQDAEGLDGSRGDDPVTAFEKHLDALSPSERALALMKFSLANPMAKAPEPAARRA